MTASATARVTCARPERYGKQLASHLGRKLSAEWNANEGRGEVLFARQVRDLEGRCEMIAGESVLLLQVTANEASIDTIEDVIGSHLVRFGAKEALEVQWVRPGGVPGTRQVAELPGDGDTINH